MSAAAKASTTHHSTWPVDYNNHTKTEDDNMLQLDELLEQDAYDEYVSPQQSVVLPFGNLY